MIHMKTIFFRSGIAAIFVIALFLVKACSEDSIETPLPSSQADFDYEVNIIVVDEEEGIEHFEVKLFNRSLLAQALLWDFGDGQTSTEENPTHIFTTPGSQTITLTVTPMHELHYNRLQKSVTLVFGKQVILFNDFSEGADFLDEDSWAPEGWQAIDNDGDGFNWYVGVSQGVYSMRSQSWAGSAIGALEPDNWLITPELDLTGFDTDARITLTYGVGTGAQTPAFKQEHYGIFVSRGSDNLDDFELVFEETLSQETPQLVPQIRDIDLSDYAGDVIFIAIRHYNVTDMDRLIVAFVEVYAVE